MVRGVPARRTDPVDAPIAVTTDSDPLDRTAARVGVDVEEVAFGA